MSEPLLTVFTIGQVASDCRLALAELQKQTIRDSLEVIVVTAERDRLDPALCEGFARFSWILVPSIDASGTVMAEAVAATRTPFVTYAEEHQYLDPGWAAAVVSAHEDGYDLVGFAMENANPGLVSWAHLYGQFGPSVAPVRSGPVAMLTGHHASYRRSLLLEYEDLLPDMLEDESALFLDQRARGRSLYMAGDAISRHVQISRLTSLIHLDFLGQRTFATSRARVGDWSWTRRIAYALAAPLIPLLRTYRAIGHVRRTGRARQLLPGLLLPLLCMTTAGAVGESLGYVLGAGQAARHRIAFELERERFVAPADGWSKDP